MHLILSTKILLFWLLHLTPYNINSDQQELYFEVDCSIKMAEKMPIDKCSGMVLAANN